MDLSTNRLVTIWGSNDYCRICATEIGPDPHTDQPITFVNVETVQGLIWLPYWQITSSRAAIDGTGIVPPRFSMSNTEVRHDPEIHATE